ncbi:MAG: hemerythrin domain-containing protein [Acidimicrobiales bacterium]
MPDAVQLLKHDHRKVEALFERYKKGDASVVPEVCTELKVHSAIEEQVLYPALGGDSLRREAQHEHQEVEDVVTKIEHASTGSAEIDRYMQALMEDVTHHVEEEEHEVLPKMSRELGHEKMETIGHDLLLAKREQLKACGAMKDQSKEELYELAQAVDISGRSDMNKDQLIHALAS